MTYRLADLAARIGGRVEGNPERIVASIQALETAGPADLSFVRQARHRARAMESGAGALLVDEDVAALFAAEASPAAADASSSADAPPAPPGTARDLLVAADSGAALALLLGVFHPEPARPAGAHPTSIVEAGATVDASVHLGPYVVIGAGSRIGAGVVVLAHAVVGRDCVLGERVLIHPHAVLYDRTEVGAGSIVHSGVILGGDGFGYASGGGVHRKLPQVGRVVLGKDVEVGCNTTIDRAMLGVTRVGDGTKIDNQVMLGHNVEVGRAAILCAKVGIAGSTRIGNGVVLGARTAAVDHIEIGDGVQAAAGTDFYTSVAAGTVVGGSPAHGIRRWRRQLVLLWKLEEMWRRLRGIEKRLGLQGAGRNEGRDGEEG